MENAVAAAMAVPVVETKLRRSVFSDMLGRLPVQVSPKDSVHF
jgi:hypothetical protein